MYCIRSATTEGQVELIKCFHSWIADTRRLSLILADPGRLWPTRAPPKLAYSIEDRALSPPTCSLEARFWLQHAQHMLQHAQNMLKTCFRTLKTCSNNAQNMLDTCSKHAQSMLKTCFSTLKARSEHASACLQLSGPPLQLTAHAARIGWPRSPLD